MSSIRLHEKYGVNPTISTCFWCGKEKNEIALLGARYRGKAPMHMVVNYEPCDDCKAQMEQGVTFIEVSDKPNREGQPPMQEERWPGEKVPYPTGHWCVLRREAEYLKRITPQELQDAILRMSKAFVPKEEWDALGLPRQELKPSI